MIKHKLYIVFVLLMFSYLGFSQNAKLDKANKLYEALEFSKAIPLYLAVLEKEDDTSAKEKLANSYRLINDVRGSEQWLQEVVKGDGSDDVYKLLYAMTLMETEKYAEAEYWLSQFLETNPSHRQASNLLNSCQNLESLRSNRLGCIVKQLPNTVNDSRCSEMGPAFYEDGIVFSSDCDTTVIKRLTSWSGRSFYDLYTTSDMGGESYSKRKRNKYGSVGTGRFHEGPVTFNADETKMFYTRNNYKKGAGIGKDSGGVIRLKIYEAARDGNRWITVDSLPFNSNDYSACHPALTEDGTKLYFASDMPGGYGGFDLYFSEKTNEGWSQATNLGPKINTEGDEVFPFHHLFGQLYFASDGLSGLGGLDIFSSDVEGIQVNTKPKNLGFPLNTPRDDFSYVLDDEGNKSYFSSNRNETMPGDDDIYSSYCDSFRLNGVVADCETDGAVKDATVTLIDENGEVVAEGITGDTGLFTFEIQPDRAYKIKGAATGYITDTISVSSVGMMTGEALQVRLPLCKEKDCPEAGTPCNDGDDTTINDVEDGDCNCIGTPEDCFISGRIFDQENSTPILGARITISDNNTGYSREAITDETGTYNFATERGTTYTVTASKECYYAETKSTNIGDCVVTIDLPLRPVLVGDINLLHIYYDLDKADIRPDAEPELSKLLTLLNDSPDLTVELASHTDSRGSDSYNLDLSQRRAESARAWLVERGLDESRISATGYGESQLVNNCSDGVDCSDKDHQDNRRTEFRITGGCGGTLYSNPNGTSTTPKDPYGDVNPYGTGTNNIYEFDK